MPDAEVKKRERKPRTETESELHSTLLAFKVKPDTLNWTALKIAMYRHRAAFVGADTPNMGYVELSK